MEGGSVRLEGTQLHYRGEDGPTELELTECHALFTARHEAAAKAAAASGYRLVGFRRLMSAPPSVRLVSHPRDVRFVFETRRQARTRLLIALAERGFTTHDLD